MSEWAVSYSCHSAAQGEIHTEAYLHHGNIEEMDARIPYSAKMELKIMAFGLQK